MKAQFGRTRWLAVAIVVALPAFLQSTTIHVPKTLEQQVRHELLTLPFYNVFDNLTFSVDGSKVTLMGQVVRPTLKSDAENVVKRIPGVTSVTNEITVLPLSPFDNSIRLRELRAIYGQPALQRYGLGAIPSIHIIVTNGEVTLEGVVASQMDKNIANIMANGVFGVFKVTNNLRIG
jgi:hyperosmotically inducible protein